MTSAINRQCRGLMPKILGPPHSKRERMIKLKIAMLQNTRANKFSLSPDMVISLSLSIIIEFAD
jgi:hypothetical protein